MKKIVRCLLAQRSDGKFLRLHESHNATGYDYVDEPELAKRILIWADDGEDKLMNPREAPYYFENSRRAREIWLKDCVMVPYEITIETNAVKI